MSDTDAVKLAKKTLVTLAKQQEYFKADGRLDAEKKGRLLRESKAMERDLREACAEVLQPTKTRSACLTRTRLRVTGAFPIGRADLLSSWKGHGYAGWL